ncbi:hypothetical protein ACFLZ7_01800 [Nanoarchaeota archaeon]
MAAKGWIITIVVLLLLVGGFFAFKTLGGEAASQGGISKIINDGSGKFNAWAGAGKSFGRRAAIIGILAAPILFMIWVIGKKEKEMMEKIVFTALTLLIMFYIAFSFEEIRPSYLFGWFISLGVVGRNYFKTKEKKDAFMTWLALGAVSMFEAPFGSLLYTQSKIPVVEVGTNPFSLFFQLGFSPLGWVFAGVILGFFGVTLKGWAKAGFNKAKEKAKTVKQEKEDKKKAEEEKKAAEEAAKATGEQKDGTEEADKTAEGVEKAVEKGDQAAVLTGTAQLTNQVNGAMGIPVIYPVIDPNLLMNMQAMLNQNRSAVHKVEDHIEGKEFYNTKVGKALAYIFKLHKEFETNLGKEGWQEFEKLKETKFKELIEHLNATGNSYLRSRAKAIEKDSEKVTPQKLKKYLENWVAEINGERKKAKKKINKAVKDLKKSEDKIVENYEKADKIEKEILTHEKTLKEYDEKARGLYLASKEMIERINNASIPREERMNLVREFRGNMKWIVEYLKDKEKYMTHFKGKFKEILDLIVKSEVAMDDSIYTTESAKNIAKDVSPELVMQMIKDTEVEPEKVEIKKEDVA